MLRSDIEIAQSAHKLKITEIAEKIGVSADALETYGKYKAKIDLNAAELKNKPDGKLILVTAINPTPAGEGKTTTSVGLADALTCLGKKTILALREPSLGPVFGIKGGAAGGGYAQVVPMEDINLHFTGDFHAVTAANNLLAALIDNHVHQGNELGIDIRQIEWKRCMDMNDRELRNIVVGLRGKVNGTPREDGFDITVASEIMAILCLADGIIDLKERISRIVIGYTYTGIPVTAGDLKAAGAMAALLKDAIKPNLVQTLEHTPTLIHGGPFANIAHGCNSVAATKTAMKLADFVVTEAGFGADLGAEKFIDIKCRTAELRPAACVIVATVRALKHHGGAKKSELDKEDLEALKRGVPNLLRHVRNVTEIYGIPAVVALNHFSADTENELLYVREQCWELGVKVTVSDVWEKGSEGGTELAEEVLRLIAHGKNKFKFVYPDEYSLKEKIETIARKIYGADGVEFEHGAVKELKRLEADGYGKLPVCMAKTQYSFSDDPKRLGAPEGFNIFVTKVRVLTGAGFVVVYTGDIMTMPGLPKTPSASMIDIDANGVISGLF